MNKLLTFEGGQPFTIEDLAFLQDSFIKSIESVVKALAGNVDCILTGIIDDNPYYSGSVYIGGNIYILTQQISGGSGKKYLCIKQTESGQRLFRDSTTHNVYLVDDAYMSETPSDVCIDITIAKTLSDILINGSDLWIENMETEGATILVPKVETGLAVKDSILVSVNKTTADSNVLWRGGNRTPEIYEGLVVYEKKIYIVSGSLMSGTIYNVDGSDYNGAISFNNLELKRRM